MGIETHVSSHIQWKCTPRIPILNLGAEQANSAPPPLDREESVGVRLSSFFWLVWQPHPWGLFFDCGWAFAHDVSRSVPSAGVGYYTVPFPTLGTASDSVQVPAPPLPNQTVRPLDKGRYARQHRGRSSFSNLDCT